MAKNLGNGGVLFAQESGTLTLTAVTFSYNFAEGGGGDIALKDLARTVAFDMLSDHADGAFGGSIYATNEALFTAHNGFFVSSNGYFGGLMYGSQYSRFNINNTSISDCSARSGAAVYLDDSTNFEAFDTLFENNSASEWGGAINMDGADGTTVCSACGGAAGGTAPELGAAALRGGRAAAHRALREARGVHRRGEEALQARLPSPATLCDGR